MQRFTLEEVAKHNKADDCWVIIGDGVFDVTKFLKVHPGGNKVLLGAGGTDATAVFKSFHKPQILTKYAFLKVGEVQVKKTTEVKDDSKFGDQVPFGDPYWYQGHASPYYNDSHRAFRAKVRAFVEKELMPYVDEWDESGTYPPELHRKAYEAGVYAPIWPKEYGGTQPKGLDPFHELIWIDELARVGAGGLLWAVFWSFGIALPPVLSIASDYIKNKVARDVITGKKIMSLAVTEPHGGSDVAGVKTTARREGDYYIVNGEKKFITSGVKASYYTVAVRTGGPGMSGLSLLLMEKGMPGLKVRRQKTQGWWMSNTAYMVFDDVKVPVENLIGAENKGFKAIMHNFNHERFVLAASSNRYARTCLEEAIKYARVRKTFNRRLIDHQAIRHKVAEMARRVEATHAWLEQIAFMACKPEAFKPLGGQCALVKVQATKTMEFCAREASQILGGASYIRGGVGSKIERLYREVRVNAIGGGSEEILLDLSMKQSKL